MGNKKESQVWLGVPGPTVTGATMQAVVRTLQEAEEGDYRVKVTNYIGGANGWLNFNHAWCDGLNQCRYGGFDYFAMLHADVDPSPHWLGHAVAALRSNPSLGLVSFPVAIKDERGLVSCGVGDTASMWWPYRRLTSFELLELPRIATISDLFALWKLKRPGGTYMIHNNGCLVIDAKLANWWLKVKNRNGGDCMPCMNFPIEVRAEEQPDGKVVAKPVCSPEDFEFSWMAHQAGIEGAILTQSPTMHWDGPRYFNSHKVFRPGQPFGMWKFDHDVGSDSAHTDEERRVLKAERRWSTPPVDPAVLEEVKV